MTENERVREVRKSEKLTLEEFGKRLGVTRGAMSAIENAVRGLTDQMCRSICREFGIREEWLRTGKGEMKVPEPSGDELDGVLDKWGLPREFRGLFIAYKNLKTDAQREAVCQFIRDAAAEIASEEAVDTEETLSKPWEEMTKEEKIAEFTRQLDEEEKKQQEESEPSGGATA